MTSTTRIATLGATALAAAILSAAPASATHVIGHTVSTAKQDVADLRERVDGHVVAARETATGAGSGTRRHVRATAGERLRSSTRAVRETRATAERTIEEQAATTQRRAHRSMATAMRRFEPARTSAQQAAGRTSTAGRAQRAGSRVAGSVRRTRNDVTSLVAVIQARMWLVAARVNATLASLLEGGSVAASIDGATYSAGWTRTGGCWKLRAGTPLVLRAGRQRHRTGATVEPMPGQRSSAQTSGGNAQASTGC